MILPQKILLSLSLPTFKLELECVLLLKRLDSAKPDKAQFALTHAKTQLLNHTFAGSHLKEIVADTAPQNEE